MVVVVGDVDGVDEAETDVDTEGSAAPPVVHPASREAPRKAPVQVVFMSSLFASSKTLRRAERPGRSKTNQIGSIEDSLYGST